MGRPGAGWPDGRDAEVVGNYYYGRRRTRGRRVSWEEFEAHANIQGGYQPTLLPLHPASVVGRRPEWTCFLFAAAARGFKCRKRHNPEPLAWRGRRDKKRSESPLRSRRALRAPPKPTPRSRPTAAMPGGRQDPQIGRSPLTLQFPAVRSRPSRSHVTVHFANETSTRIRILWINFLVSAGIRFLTTQHACSVAGKRSSCLGVILGTRGAVGGAGASTDAHVRG